MTATSRVDLADVAGHALDQASAEATEHGVTVRRAPAPVVIAGRL